ncbi:MAG: HlyD family efflux transporter periplasmic adaptor subunit [Cyclobacteriaceae bacterium]|nr:HlyD family efflux transporter periplasmic adaptor subunit [Cyclobacteriaceae bacterium]
MDRKIKKKKWTFKRISLYAVGLLFVSFVLYSFFFADKRSKLNVDVEKITIAEVKFGVFQDFIPVTGGILPSTTRYLDAREGGIIQSIEKETGELVKKGDVILRLANSNLELSVLSQQAALYEQINRSTTTRLSLNQNDLNQRQILAEIDMNINLYEPQYKRFKQLYEKDLISKREFEEVEERYKYNVIRKDLTYASYRIDSTARMSQLQELNASENRMRQSLEGVNMILDNLVVRARIDGQLATPDHELGQSIVRGDRLGQIDVVGSYKVRVRIDELYLPRVDVGLKGSFPQSRTNYGLVITKIFPTITEGRFEVDMEFTGDQPESIKRGLSVRIRLELGNSAQALLLPMGEFYKDSGGNWVFLVDESGNRAIKKEIRLGRKNSEFFEVMGGLEAGQKVITSSYDHFGDNEVLILK